MLFRSNDLLINEVLFNPPSDGKDFIEIYNNTAAVINLNELYISSVNALGGWNTSYKVGDGYYNFFPGEYAVLTEDSSFIKKHWPNADSKKIIQVTNLPSMPDDRGNIAILDKQGKVIDMMNYDEKMQLKMYCFELMSKRWRIQNIRTSDNQQIFIEIDKYDQPDTIFEVTAAHAVLDPFGKIGYYEAVLLRSEVQTDVQA